jgi:exonuclease III
MLNMNGAMSHDTPLISKWSEISGMLYEHKIMILALQETHLNQQMTDQLRETFSKNLEILASEDPTAPTSTAGIAFVINKALINPTKITAHELVQGRALLLKIKWLESCEMSILNIYAPVNRAAQLQFWQTIENERCRKSLLRPNFVLGDFNITEEAIDRAPPRLDDQTASEALRNIRLKWEIQDAWRHSHPNVREYTYRTNSRERTSKSRLDRIYAAKHLQQLLFNWKHCPATASTDH